MKKDLTDEILDSEWYENVTNAVSYALDNLPDSTDAEKVFDTIIEYNIKRKVHEYIVENGTKTLNRKLDWRNKTANQAFTEYKDIIDTCDICTTFKSFTFHIKLKRNEEKLKKLFMLWRELTNSYYPTLKVFSKECEYGYKVMIKKWSN